MLTSPIKLVKRARSLRKEMSLPEVLLWRELKRRPGGFKFRRQLPQCGYILDFACLEARLGIEIDGEAHEREDRVERDRVRDQQLIQVGFNTIRFPARDVLQNIEGVVTSIIEWCRASGPLHQPAAGPPPRAGEDFE
ncbi:endonuclease domain-containing protein [Allosphingosinicella flava]|uniref:endonuclease domain-containing protein n=1 Tax=Allosphingosinicella flava TaxID=2771430 RepID=UPI001CF7E207|nr:DUF559 domain-containing protein [Sphingosinicella flava]